MSKREPKPLTGHQQYRPDYEMHMGTDFYESQS